MTGWRLGWMVGRQDLMARAAQLNEFMVSCAAGFVQKAGEIALAEGEAELQRDGSPACARTGTSA